MNVSKPKEACGVFALSMEGSIYLSDYLTAGLKSLQHRGEDGAGIAYPKAGEPIQFIKSLGLVSDLCHEHTEALGLIYGMTALGHVRYGTQGGNDLDFVQPVGGGHEDIALAFNGQINPKGFKSDSARLYDRFTSFLSDGKLEDLTFVNEDEAFSVVGVWHNRVYAFRDCRGTRPLFYAKFRSGGYEGTAVASETCAFTHLNPYYIEEIFPGSLIVLEAGKLIEAHQIPVPSKRFCAFEGMYFSREDSLYGKTTMYDLRKQLGQALAASDIELDIQADVVIGVPQSGLPAALGYANYSQCTFELGIIKSRYNGRSFIQPNEQKRLSVLQDKLHVQGTVVQNKHVVLVDDTLVRGHTMKFLVSQIKKAGAKSVHVRIAAPPILSPCSKGVDTGRETKLPASDMPLEGLENFIGSDSLKFLSIEDIKRVMGESICLECFL